MRVYLNGPVDEVRGVAEMTAATAKEIRALGHTVCVGRELWLGNLPTTKRYHMAVQLLLRCDAIYNMVGCALSLRATQMQRVALLAGMDQLAVDSGQLAVGSWENVLMRRTAPASPPVSGSTEGIGDCTMQPSPCLCGGRLDNGRCGAAPFNDRAPCEHLSNSQQCVEEGKDGAE